MTINELERVRALVAPIASDLDLDLYDVERRSNVIRVTLDTPPGSESGISLDALSLATRLISREIDHEDPVPGSFTLEVTSPGLERTLRTPAHFLREVGKEITLRLSGHAVSDGEPRRLDGVLSAATETDITVTTDDGVRRTVAIDAIDKARTVFEWGPAPKPGGSKKQNGKKQAGKQNGKKQGDTSSGKGSSNASKHKEKQQS